MFPAQSFPKESNNVQDTRFHISLKDIIICSGEGSGEVAGIISKAISINIQTGIGIFVIIQGMHMDKFILRGKVITKNDIYCRYTEKDEVYDLYVTQVSIGSLLNKSSTYVSVDIEGVLFQLITIPSISNVNLKNPERFISMTRGFKRKSQITKK
jgi:hypothetical protein